MKAESLLFGRLIAVAVSLGFAITTKTLCAWSASGHHMVGVVAYELMGDEQRGAVMKVLQNHPQFDRYFQPPEGMTDPGSIERWQIGLAGCWPDIIRDSPYDRPTWHYELAANQVIGKFRTPRPPGPPPRGSDLQSQELYLSQAMTVCLAAFIDPATSDSDRAIALCWILHLFADGHQPCHAGSLYAPSFPDGDRGGNSIRLADGSNLHAAWDGLLGGYPSANEVRQRVHQLGDVRDEMMPLYQHGGAGDWLRPATWLEESRSIAKTYVYTDEVTGPVIAASRGLTKKVPRLNLSPQYYREAGEIASYRIKQAGFRVAAVLVRCLRKSAQPRTADETQ